MKNSMELGNGHVRLRLSAGVVHAAALVAIAACANTVQYSEDRSIFPNPERGFWWSMDPPGGSIPGQTNLPHAPFQLEELRALRGKPQAFSLIRDCIQLGMFMNLPDPYPSLHDRPEYSIWIANEAIWEPSSGFNRLGHIVNISR